MEKGQWMVNKVNWKNKMIQAMNMIAKACSERDLSESCSDCPFYLCCILISNEFDCDNMNVVMINQVRAFMEEQCGFNK